MARPSGQRGGGVVGGSVVPPALLDRPTTPVRHKINKDVALVRNFYTLDDDKFVVFEKFKVVRNFFSYPLDSTQLGISRVSQLSGVLESCPITAIGRKCMIFYNN